MRKILFFLTLTLTASNTVKAGNPPKFDHVIIVVMENHGYSDIIGSSSAPYINALADSGALFTSSYALTHPSQPNYLAFFSGSTQGVSDDYVPSGAPFTTANLGHSLLLSGYSFKGYSETEPSKGFTGAGSGKYARRHAPWVNWQGTGTNQLPDSVNLPYTYFPVDYTQLPTVSFVIPNLDDDMHDGTISQGDKWLKLNLDSFKRWSTAHNSLLIVTWDEDDNSGSNHVATLFYGAHVVKGTYSENITHYAVLRTILDMYSITPFANAAKDSAIRDCWTPTGIENLVQRDNGLKIIPLGRNTYNLHFESALPEGMLNVTLIDVEGHLVHKAFFNTAQDNVYHIPAAITPGSYIIAVKGNNVNCTKKIVLGN